jgi:hypothetical protein
VADEPARGANLDRERLETLREGVVAQVTALSEAERRELISLVDATLARIDAELERLEEPQEAPPLT